MVEFLKKSWSAWKWFAAKVAYFNSLVLLTAFFLTVVGPVNLVIRLLGKDLLRLREPPAPDRGYWLPAHSDNTSLGAWRRQF